MIVPGRRPLVAARIVDDSQDGECDGDERRDGTGQDELVTPFGKRDDEHQQERSETQTSDNILFQKNKCT